MGLIPSWVSSSCSCRADMQRMPHICFSQVAPLTEIWFELFCAWETPARKLNHDMKASVACILSRHARILNTGCAKYTFSRRR